MRSNRSPLNELFCWPSLHKRKGDDGGHVAKSLRAAVLAQSSFVCARKMNCSFPFVLLSLCVFLFSVESVRSAVSVGGLGRDESWMTAIRIFLSTVVTSCPARRSESEKPPPVLTQW